MSYTPPIGDATSSAKGVLRLSGDLSGTATTPTVPGLASKVDDSDSRLTDARTPIDASVTDAKVASNAAISLDKTADGTDRLAMTADERTKLAGLTGAIYVTTTNATLPALDDGTVIARYSATIPATPVVSSVGTNTSIAVSNTITVTTTASIPAGDIIVVGYTRGTGSTSTAGTMAVTLASGAVSAWQTPASANRASTVEVELQVGMVTTTIPSGTVVTVTTSGNSTNRINMAVAGIHNLTSAVPEATSGDDANGVAGSASAGANTAAATLSAPTDATTTSANTLVLGLFGFNTSATWSFLAATQIAYTATAAGSSDRGLILGYKVATTAAIQSTTVNGTASTGVAGVTLALPIPMVEA